MKQRLAIANAIMHHPQILILDEPTNGLDPIGILEMRQFLRELSASQGISILISSHIISEVEKLVDRIGILHGGHLFVEKNMQDTAANLENSTVHLVLSDAIQAKEVLDKLAMFKKVSVLSDTELVLAGDSFDIAKIASILKENGIVIKEYSRHEKAAPSTIEHSRLWCGYAEKGGVAVFWLELLKLKRRKLVYLLPLVFLALVLLEFAMGN